MRKLTFALALGVSLIDPAMATRLIDLLLMPMLSYSHS